MGNQLKNVNNCSHKSSPTRMSEREREREREME